MDIEDREEAVRQLRPWKRRFSRVAFVISRGRVGAAFAVVTIGTASLIWAAAPQVDWGHAHVMPGGFPVTTCFTTGSASGLVMGWEVLALFAVSVAAVAWISRKWWWWIRGASIIAHLLVAAIPVWVFVEEIEACEDQERRDWENLERYPPYVELNAEAVKAAVEAERRAQEEAIRRAPGPLCDCQPNDPLCSCE
jgi:hypothetical protein